MSIICKKCGIDKSEDFFYRRSDNNKLHKMCKKCYKDNYSYNKEEKRKYDKQKYKNNKEKIIKQKEEYNKNRYQTDISYRIMKCIRTRIYGAIKNNWKSEHTIELLGCSIDELKKHLESKFLLGMTWENYGRYGWHIDHVIPCALFDLSIVKEQKECFHYTNLQPLWAEENIRKGANKYENASIIC